MTKKERIVEVYNNYPHENASFIAEKSGCKKRYVRKVLAKLREDTEPTKEQSESDFYKLSIMAGLKKRTIPLKYRKILAELVMSIEDNLQRTPIVKLKKSSNKKETAVLLLSDQHVGKLVYNDSGTCLYNKDICTFRLSLLKERVKKLLTEHLILDNIDEFVICMLGDIIDGSEIYENQGLNQDLSCWSDQLSVATAGIWDLILSIRELGLPVKIYGVPGNHGRQSSFAPVNNNLDYIVLQMLYLLSYKDNNINITYSTTTPYLNFNIKDYNIHIRHMAPPQTETAAAKSKFGGWQTIHDWDVMCFGHLHHANNMSFMGMNTFMNGSPIGIDDLSERMAVYSRPSQTMFGIAPNIGVSFTYNIYLDIIGEEKGKADRLLNKYPNLKSGGK